MARRASGPTPDRSEDALDATDWSGLVVFCAGNPWDGNRYPDQHMAERLAAYAPVLYVDPPLSVAAAWRSRKAGTPLPDLGVRRIGHRLARVTPFAPPYAGRRWVRAISDAATRATIRRSLRALGRPKVHAVVASSFAPVFGVAGEDRRVFYSTDDFVAGAALIKVSVDELVRHEARQVAAADTVVVCSPNLEERYRSMGLEPLLVPNGCDDQLFAGTDAAPLPTDVTLPAPVAGFVGHLTDRIDLSLLEAVADRGISLLLVGAPSPSFDMTRLDSLVSRPNVQSVGAKPFEDLPSYLRVIDVGLLPYGDSEFNRGSFPLKMLEYLAAGRATVATGLPAVRWLDTDLIDIADDPEAFADAVESAASRERTPQMVADRHRFASLHGWSGRAREMAEILGLPS